MSEVQMFNLTQAREDNRVITLEEFLDEKKKEYEAYLPFNRAVLALQANSAKLDPLRPDKDKKGTTITKRKDNFKTSLATNVNIVCLKATGYALSIGDDDLAQAVRFRSSDITGAKDSNVTGIVSKITDALTPLLDVPAFTEYEITADMLTALTQGAEDFDNTRGKADVVDIASSLANDQINQIFTDIRGIIASLRRLLAHFYISNPDFVKGFTKAATIDYSGMRQSGVVAEILDKKEMVIDNATMTLTRKDTVKTATISDEGTYEIIKCIAGNWKLTIAAPGYETQTVTIKIVRGEIQKLSINMQSAVMEMQSTQTA